MSVHYAWDERKRRSNLRKHGLDFRDVQDVFAGLTYTLEDDRFRYPEPRYLTVGWLSGTVVSIVHTETDGMIRVISFRKATRHEEEFLFASIQN